MTTKLSQLILANSEVPPWIAEAILKLEEENERLRHRVEDHEDDFRKVVSEKCAPDERHCSCVPHLREGMKLLRAERDHFREAWAAAQAKLDTGADVSEAIREERDATVAFLRETLATSETAYASDDLDYSIAIIERGAHRH